MEGEPPSADERDTVKRCTRCKSSGPLEMFGSAPKSRDGRHSWCKTCLSESSRASYHRDPSKAIASVNKWKQRNPVVYREARAAWREKNRERLRVQGQMDSHKRRAITRGALGREVTPEQWDERKYEFGGRCAYCNERAEVLEMEHMDPLSCGGIHDMDNIVPACRECNASKYTLTALEFLTGFRLDRKAAVAI